MVYCYQLSALHQVAAAPVEAANAQQLQALRQRFHQLLVTHWRSADDPKNG